MLRAAREKKQFPLHITVYNDVTTASAVVCSDQGPSQNNYVPVDVSDKFIILIKKITNCV